MLTNAPGCGGGPCCQCQSRNSTCSKCVCAQSGRRCKSCCAMSLGTCRNGPCEVLNGPDHNTLDFSPDSVNNIATDEFVDTKLHLAFGATILRNDGGGFCDSWGAWWLRACHIFGKQYDLPGGAVGREFVDLLTSEVRLLVNNSVVSDRLMMFCPVLLQRNCMVKTGSDVRRLLRRRMEMEIQ